MHIGCGLSIPTLALKRPGGVSKTALPQAASILARWSADQLAPQADNTDLTAWSTVDSAYTATKSSSTAPKYRTSGQSGKPYIQFTGVEVLDTGVSGTGNALSNLFNGSNSYTALVVVRNPLTTSAGSPLMIADNNAATSYRSCLTANGSTAGLFYPTMTAPWTNTGQQTGPLGILIHVDKSATGQSRVWLNGSAVSTFNTTNGTAANQTIRIGGSLSNSILCYKGELYDVIIWNRALTHAEIIQAYKWMFDNYSVAYPWAGAPYRVWHGDSITLGYGALPTIQNTMPWKASMTRMALRYGQWSNFAVTGASYDNSGSGAILNLKDRALYEIDPLVSALGVPIHLFNMEWYNQKAGGSAANITRAIAYMNARRSAGVAKIAFATSTTYGVDTAASPDAQRAAYNAYWDVASNRTGIMDAYAALHLDSTVGVAGACPSVAPGSPNYLDDLIHPTAAGTTAMEAVIGPVMASL